ncbi:MAG: SDR family NAD(P)-dependent oxidoreductase [Alphaproteobacteria bacterium]|nr:SDR family NAD(P)-dependent oxidoreductase [Alphaproteobacteria bacterium]
MQALKGRQVLIVGGYGEIGKALIPALKEQKAEIIIGDVKKNRSATFEGIPYFRLNASAPDSIEKFRAHIEGSGYQLAHVVNVVGGLKESGLTDMFKTTSKEILKTVNTNLLSQLYIVHGLAQHIKETPGDKSFVSVGSVNSQLGFSIPFYSAAKGGMLSFVKPAAMDLGRYGIRINVVSPGTIITESTKKQPKDFEDRKKSAALGRLCTTTDVADAILMCLKMENYTGQNLIIDAGQTAGAASSLFEQQRRNSALHKSLEAFHL